MSDCDRWRRLRHAAMAVRVGVLVVLAFLSPPATFSWPVGDAHAQQQPAGKVYRIGFLSQGHPGGHITGVAINVEDMLAKRVQLLKELVPALKRVAMLSHPPHPTNAMQVQGAMAAARALGVQFVEVPVRGPDDFAPALKA